MESDRVRSSATLILDSSFLVAFHNAEDVHHEAAMAVMSRILDAEWETVLLLEYVVLEVLTVLRMRVDLDTAVSVGDVLLSSREVQFVPCSDIFLRTLETFRQEEQAGLSFVDAAIVTVARESPPGFVASFDTDFAQVDGISVVAR